MTFNLKAKNREENIEKDLSLKANPDVYHYLIADFYFRKKEQNLFISTEVHT